MTRCLRISRFLALLGSVLTLVQICLLLVGDNGICLNDGCKIVDSLTTVSPIFFNLGGLVFFQIIFWWFKYIEGEGWSLSFARWVLLGALSAEGVLFSFQHFIIDTYCSYCLIVFLLVVLLNVLAGIRQIFSGLAAFLAIIIAFSCLQFAGAGGDLVKRMDEGTFARLPGQEDRTTRYLFFSSSCTHCEEVIKALADVHCAVSFNPVDSVEDVPLAGVSKTAHYNSAVNSRLLESFGINQVPTLLVKSHSEYKILTGTEAIEEYFEAYRNTEASGNSTESSGNKDASVEQSQQPETSVPVSTEPQKEETQSSVQQHEQGESSVTDAHSNVEYLPSHEGTSQKDDDTCTVGKDCD